MSYVALANHLILLIPSFLTHFMKWLELRVCDCMASAKPVLLPIPTPLAGKKMKK